MAQSVQRSSDFKTGAGFPNHAALVRAVGDENQARAQAEPLNADLERSAVALEQVFE